MDAEDIVELFSGFGPVVVRRIFGGAGIFAQGMSIGIIASDGIIYLKVDDANAEIFDRENCGPFTYPRGGKLASLFSYRKMPDRLYDDPDELATWARGSFGAAQRQAASKSKPKVAKKPVAKKPAVAKKKAARKKQPGNKASAKKKAAKRQPPTSTKRRR